jgi:hypothetical protein
MVAFVTYIPGCGNQSAPSEPDAGVTGVTTNQVPVDALPRDANQKALRMLSRSVAAGAERVAVIDATGPDDDRTFTFRVLDETMPTVTAGTILLGEPFGAAREVVRAQRKGDVVTAYTRVVDYSPVTDAGEVTFEVPLEGGAGEADGVRWGAWKLVNTTTGQSMPLEEDLTQSDFFSFDDISICAEGGGVSGCGDFKVRVIEGYLRSEEGALTVSIQSDYPNELAPLARIGINRTISAKLVLEIEGNGRIQYEKCVYGFCMPDFALVREFEAGNITGSVQFGIFVGIRTGVQDVIVQPGLEIENLNMDFGVSVGDELHFDFEVPQPTFEPSFEVISLGEGYFRSYVGPKFKTSVDALGGWVEVGAEISAFVFAEDTIDLDELFADCQLWHVETVAGVEIKARAWGKVGGASKNKEWPEERSTKLMDWWSTGDMKVTSVTTGVDPDWNGYVVSGARQDADYAPQWTNTLGGWLGCNDDLVLNGGFLCHKFPDWVPYIGGIQDCDLVSTYHDVSVADVMWNCAVSGGNDAVVCVEPFKTTNQTFEVSCISVFQALCLTVDEYLESGMIRNAGLAQSLKAKFLSAEDARDRGQPEVAENKLRAATHELAAQHGKGMQPDVMNVLTERIQTVVAHYLFADASHEATLSNGKTITDGEGR